VKKMLMGSRYFFSCYDDFVSKDIDEIAIISVHKSAIYFFITTPTYFSKVILLHLNSFVKQKRYKNILKSTQTSICVVAKL
jgi:hypothetical protein